MAATFVQTGRNVNSTAGNAHSGWDTVNSLVDGSCFLWMYLSTVTNGVNMLGLGRGLGPGAYFQYQSYFAKAIDRSSTSQIKLYEAGVLTQTVTYDSSEGYWFQLERTGSTVTLKHLENTVLTFSVAADYLVGGQAYGSGVRHHVHLDWDVVGAGGTISENGYRYEIEQAAGGGSTLHPLYATGRK